MSMPVYETSIMPETLIQNRVLKLASANADLAVSERITAPIWPKPCSTVPALTRHRRCARAVPRVAA